MDSPVVACLRRIDRYLGKFADESADTLAKLKKEFGEIDTARESEPMVYFYKSSTAHPEALTIGGYFVDYLYIYHHKKQFHAGLDLHYNSPDPKDSSYSTQKSFETLEDLINAIKNPGADAELQRLNKATNAHKWEQDEMNAAWNAEANRNAAQKFTSIIESIKLTAFEMYDWRYKTELVWACIVCIVKPGGGEIPIGRLTRKNGQHLSVWQTIEKSTDHTKHEGPNHVELALERMQPLLKRLMDGKFEVETDLETERRLVKSSVQESTEYVKKKGKKK